MAAGKLRQFVTFPLQAECTQLVFFSPNSCQPYLEHAIGNGTPLFDWIRSFLSEYETSVPHIVNVGNRTD
jgi:hypothetical protein